MNQIIKDWIEFCEQGTVFEDGHFYTLFTDITLDEIKKVYQTFPNSDNLIMKMEKFLFESRPIITTHDNKKNALETLVRLDFQERKSILQKLDAFGDLNTDLNFLYVSDVEIVNTLILDDVWSQSFHDFMRMQKISTEKKCMSFIMLCMELLMILTINYIFSSHC